MSGTAAPPGANRLRDAHASLSSAVGTGWGVARWNEVTARFRRPGARGVGRRLRSGLPLGRVGGCGRVWSNAGAT